ncbi:hypothetical protein RUM44_000182 [Polyplax serrata]|uniref:Uncharacterized protein n=1 Tax=Polyplax serrata TaxID=468196 RepID=A0ABR1B5G3_POLSC
MELAYPDNLEEKEMVEDPEHLLNTWLDELDSLTGLLQSETEALENGYQEKRSKVLLTRKEELNTGRAQVFHVVYRYKSMLL